MQEYAPAVRPGFDFSCAGPQSSAPFALLRSDMPAAVSPILAWLRDPSAERGIHFARQDGGWSFRGYDELAELAWSAAAGLGREGVRRGDVVSLVGRSGPELVAAFFGALLAGAVPSLAAPPIAFQDLAGYRAHTAGVLRTARPALVVADAEFVDELGRLAEGVARVTGFGALFGGEGAPAEPGGGALLQFTSGSSGVARAVRVPLAALEANVAAIGRWLGWTPDSPFASWLPLHHDMGLVGGLISPVVNRADLWLLQPEHFIRDPMRYLRCLGGGAQLTATPNFGLDLVARRVSPAALEGLDFSAVRGIVIGAERIDPATLERFHALLAPFGLRREALLPAYGLAEATLAVSGVPRGAGWSSVALDPASLAPGHAVRPAEGEASVVVGCGTPLDGVSVVIVDEESAVLGEGRVGEIVVRGDSLAAGYVGDDAVSLTTLSGGELRTGDAGFLLDGQLFVLGRRGDSLKVRGRVVFSEELEAALAGAGAARPRIAVLLGVHEGAATVVVVTEEAAPRWRGAAEELLQRMAGGAGVVFVRAPGGVLPRTSSGKPRRRALWNSFVEGALLPTEIHRGEDVG